MAENTKKIVNLMEDSGNFHDDNELQKSLNSMSEDVKKHLNE